MMPLARRTQVTPGRSNAPAGTADRTGWGLADKLLSGHTARPVGALALAPSRPPAVVFFPNPWLLLDLELGVDDILLASTALAVAAGRSPSAGGTSTGALTAQVLFQGVLGWFNPNSSAATPAKYYRARGVVAIHGKVYGSVDFVVIKVAVSLDAYAQAAVAFDPLIREPESLTPTLSQRERGRPSVAPR